MRRAASDRARARRFHAIPAPEIYDLHNLTKMHAAHRQCMTGYLPARVNNAKGFKYRHDLHFQHAKKDPTLSFSP